MSDVHLFSPGMIGNKSLANRTILAPMTRVSGLRNGCVGPLMHDYYAAFARGGFGMIITEGLYTDLMYSQGYQFQPGLALDAQADSWVPIVSAVKREGALMIAQLMHAGALSQHNEYQNNTVAPSAIKPKGQQMPFYYGEGEYPIPETLSVDQIQDIVVGFICAAKRAQEAGFDGVEVHAANGYLLDQFLTTDTNSRSDAYGGSEEKQFRIVRDIILGIKEVVAKDFIVGVRFSQAKVNDAEYKIAGADVATTRFSAAEACGVDYIHITEPDCFAAAFNQGPSLGQLATASVSIPIIINGGLEKGEDANAALEKGHGHYTAIGKASLANSDWPLRVQAGDDLEEFDFGMLAPIANIENEQRYKSGK